MTLKDIVRQSPISYVGCIFLCRALGAKLDNKRSLAYRISMLYLITALKKRNLTSKIFKSKKHERNLIIKISKFR